MVNLDLEVLLNYVRALQFLFVHEQYNHEVT